MTPALLIGIGLLGGLGAVARLLVDSFVTRRARGPFPDGTLAVNLSGALALGVLVGAAVSADAARLAGTGLLGAYTTFSTWMFDSHRLAEDRRPIAAALNVAVSLVLGIGAVFLGRRIGTAL